MNKTAIEWCDFTWNPLTGCTRGCNYCYARRMAYRLRGRYGYPQDDPFAPTFHPDRLHEPSERKKPAKIFTCSMGEMFDPKVEWPWVQEIFFEMVANPRHTFQVLTKQVDRALEHSFPNNCWIGVSQDGRFTDVEDIERLSYSGASVKFVSFEPLLGQIPDLDTNLTDIDWVIIGARTGPGAKPPEKEWVEDIINAARNYDIPVFLKDNLHWHEQVREWPKPEAER